MNLAEVIEHSTPMGDKIICQQIPDDELESELPSGLYIPDASRDLHQRHLQAEIVAVGPDVMEPTLLPGLRVFLKRWSQNFIGDEGRYFVVRERDIEAVMVLNI